MLLHSKNCLIQRIFHIFTFHSFANNIRHFLFSTTHQPIIVSFGLVFVLISIVSFRFALLCFCLVCHVLLLTSPFFVEIHDFFGLGSVCVCVCMFLAYENLSNKFYNAVMCEIGAV